jgi:hypothetical protein
MSGEGSMYTEPALVTRARDVRSRKVRWLHKGYTPLGYVTIQSGETKLGKSTYFALEAAQVTTGTLPGELHGSPSSVLIIATEDGREDLWKPRLVAAGADLDRVGFINVLDGWNVRDGVSVIDGALDEFPAPCVFIDAVMEHLPEARGGETANSSTFVRQALRPFARLCERRQIAGKISTHPPKGRAGGFADAFHGSSAFIQLSRSCLLFGWHPDDRDRPEDERRRVLLRPAGNIGRDPGALSFRIGGKVISLDDGEHDEIGYAHDIQQCAVTARDLLNADRLTAGPERDRPKVDELADRIRNYLRDGGWHPSIRAELEAEGFAGGTIHAAQKRVARARKAFGTMAAGWEWRLLPSETADRSTDAKGLARTGGVSPQPDTSTDQAKNPTNTEESKCQTSLTNGFGHHSLESPIVDLSASEGDYAHEDDPGASWSEDELQELVDRERAEQAA